ncbi:hypothetical protein [Agrococcus sp. ARC_14]|uniref:hypothetical protein n=1 Tax=Agrococcus sp. ARC_14 TaxID=2919927 RepID=UPI001F0583A3|nr:hypothetical protein [Agrococcus sp. ARC_14]MCH1881348.1 hypothetical protein [Agrococcus sp. ARC_14]
MTAVYAADDPRSQLGVDAAATRAVGDDVLPFQHYELDRSAHAASTDRGSRTWVVRAQNVVVAWTELVAGDALERQDVDEVMLLVLSAAGPVEVETDDERVAVEAMGIVIVPPGRWRISTAGDARVLRLHATSASDLLELAVNRELYEPAPASIAKQAPWPPPRGGDRLRVYADLEDIEQSPDRMGRIFRNRHVMVNVLYPRVGPRDPRALSPHDHDDFEQLSIAYEGTYVHHIRAHWGKDRTQWRADEHVVSASPSIAVIPPPLVHTSEAVGDAANCMVDVFAGPRADFSARPGWVLNAADYPEPEAGE